MCNTLIRHSRTGTLWEGRHKSSLVEADSYLLACYRYIELNPVRAAMVAHQCYEALGLNNEQRQYAYRELFSVDLGDKIHDIRKAVNFSMPLGNTRFQLNSMMFIPLIDLFY